MEYSETYVRLSGGQLARKIQRFGSILQTLLLEEVYDVLARRFESRSCE